MSQNKDSAKNLGKSGNKIPYKTQIEVFPKMAKKLSSNTDFEVKTVQFEAQNHAY